MSTVTPHCVLCKTEPAGRPAVATLRRVFVELEVGKCPVVQSANPPRAGEFLRVEFRKGELYPTTVAMCTLFDGVTTPYKRGKRKTLFLRNLRIRGDGLGFRHLLLCASCGSIQRLSAEELDAERPERCGQCRASLSTLICPVHHAFGHCSECTELVVEDAPFDAPEPVCAADPAMQPV